jgi:hypothetical protein
MKKCFSPRLARERRDRRSQLATAHHAVQERSPTLATETSRKDGARAVVINANCFFTKTLLFQQARLPRAGHSTIIAPAPPGSERRFRSRYTGIMLRVLRPLPIASLKLLVFDLDGTLIDSAQDLCNSVNAALGHLGASRCRTRPIAGFVGNGVLVLVRRALAAAQRNSADGRWRNCWLGRRRFLSRLLSRAQAGLHLRLRGSSGGAGGAEAIA